MSRPYKKRQGVVEDEDDSDEEVPKGRSNKKRKVDDDDEEASQMPCTRDSGPSSAALPARVAHGRRARSATTTRRASFRASARSPWRLSPRRTMTAPTIMTKTCTRARRTGKN